MDATITLQEGMYFVAMPDSGFAIHMDSGAAAGEQSRGASPMELLMISLAGCTAMDVISILRKKRQNVTGFEVRIHGDRATDHPKIFTDFVIEYVVRGKDIDPKAVARSIELSTESYCSVHAMLDKSANIRTTFTVVAE